LGRITEAVEAFGTAATLAPDRADAWFALGVIEPPINAGLRKQGCCRRVVLLSLLDR
jgi:hypothetical protein